MFKYLSTPFCVLVLSAVSSLQGQVRQRTDAISPRPYFDYIYSWDGSEATLYGRQARFVEDGDNPRIAASPRTFSAGQAGDSFGYRMTGVQDWDSAAALAAIEAKEFERYLATLTAADVDRHADIYDPNPLDPLNLGWGINSPGDGEIPDTRRDRVDQIGEALILTFDTLGSLSVDRERDGNQSYDFEPTASSFDNTGLSPRTALLISDLNFEPTRQDLERLTARMDYFFYDASEKELITGQSSEPGHALGIRVYDFNPKGTLAGSWILDDGDMIILAAHAPFVNPGANNPVTSWSLWSFTADLIDAPPAGPEAGIPASMSRLGTAAFRIEFDTENSIQYIIYYSDSLVPDDWQEVDAISGTGARYSYDIPANLTVDTDRGFFKVTRR